MAERAQVGDLVRIIAEWSSEKGKIFEVDGVLDTGFISVINGDSYPWLSDSEYVIHRKAGEEDGERVYVKTLGEDDGKFISKTEYESQFGADDAVNHPQHYTQGRFETIEIIEEITQGYQDGYVAYCVGNALKYLARAPFKHESPSEDIAKARAYLDFAVKRQGGEA